MTNSDAAAMFDGHVARQIVSAISGELTSSTPAPAGQVPWESVVGTYRIGAAKIIVQRDGDHLTVAGDRSIWQLWERKFSYRGRGVFAAVGNDQFRVTFAPFNQSSTSLSCTLSGRAFGDASRVP